MGSPGSELRDGMRIDWDVLIEMDDGLVLRADVYRPEREGRFPVILSYGPYAKGLAFQEGYPSAWQRMVAEHPDVAYGSRTGKSSTQRSGSRTDTPACASIPAAPGARPGTSTISLHAKPGISIFASNGPGCSAGRTARSG